MASFVLVLTLGTLGERQDTVNGAWRNPFLTEMAKALPTNALLGGWNSKSLLGGGAEAVVSNHSREYLPRGQTFWGEVV